MTCKTLVEFLLFLKSLALNEIQFLFRLHFEELKGHGFTTFGSSQSAPDTEKTFSGFHLTRIGSTGTDRVRNEVNRTIEEARIDAAGVETAGGMNPPSRVAVSTIACWRIWR